MSIDMVTLLFSIFLGALVIIVYPTAMTLALASESRMTQLERLSMLRVSTLVAATLLAFYTHFWVTPEGIAVLINATTLWVFCAVGVAVFFGLTPFARNVSAS